MAPPIVNAITQRILDRIQPVLYAEEDNEYALTNFIEGWTRVMLLAEAVARDTDAGPGWSPIMQPETAPDEFLDYLGQFIGIHFEAGVSPASKRTIIRGLGGMRRGSPAAIVAAVRATLTDTVNGTVFLFERFGGDPYAVHVATFVDETPNPAATQQAALAQKPAGIVMTFETVDHDSFDTLYNTHANFQSVYTTFTDFDEVATNPGKT